jgi:predicted aspartyl protease
VPIYRAPIRNASDLKLHGPRLKIKIAPPILRLPGSPRSGALESSRFTETDALIDTGAQRTVLSPEAVKNVGLSKINQAELRVVGAIVKADVYVASLQFPLCGLNTIEVIEVSCCELPHILYHCLIGRDVLSRWTFHYDGPAGKWQILENETAAWVDPPQGFDPDLWGE